MKKDDLIFEKFKNTVFSRHLLENTEVVIVGLSGGSDSVSLLILMDRLRKENNSFRLVALHFNHEIRGKEADSDESFSKDLCEKLNIPFFARRGDVPRFSKENKISLEEAARIMRYGALQSLAEEFEREDKKTKIAVAHNLNDRAETVLFNILRGTSVDGLRGIRYQNGNIVRPLLDISKEETFEICKSNNVDWRTDSTNLTDDCTRNKIRLDVIPYLTKEMGFDISEKLLSLSILSEKDSDYLTNVSNEIYDNIVSKNGLVDIERLRSLHEAIKSRVIINAVKNAKAYGKVPFEGGNGISETLVKRVIKFLEGSDKGTIELGRNLYLTKNGCNASFGEKPIPNSVPCKISSIEIDLNESEEWLRVIDFGSEKITICAELIGIDAVPRKMANNVVYFDVDVLKKEFDGKLVVRNPIFEDRFFPYGGSGSKKLSRYLIDKKVPREKRDELIVVSSSEKVLHIFDVARSKYAALCEMTKNVLRISIKRNKE